MDKICKILSIGSQPVPDPWISTINTDINRMYYITGGLGGYIIDNKKIPFKVGQLYIIPALAEIPTYTDKVDRLVHTYVDFEMVPPIISNDVLCFDPTENPLTSRTFNLLEEFCKTKKRVMLEEDELDILQSCTIFLVNYAAKICNKAILKDKTILFALNKIHFSLSEKLSVEDLAAECFMSTNGFIRKFKKHTGKTPSAYIKSLKIRTALIMRENKIPLNEIAANLGYADSSSLLHAISSSNK